ncbi:hypothetical protein HDU97_004202 [Phlyctochytrium planicorne]|nr:hypothetical protein HDU97_004202 [Phlyctochytrium planicorne]
MTETQSIIAEPIHNVDFSTPSGHLSMNSFCYKCHDSGLRQSQMDMLYTSSVEDPLQIETALIPKRQRSPLIRCDYCCLWWHLDCLDPPQLLLPLEYRTEPDIINLRSVKDLRMKYWGQHAGDSVDFAERTLFKEIHPYLSLDSESKRGRDNSGVEMADINSILQIRGKWMCPCHVEWSLPPKRHLRRWKYVRLDETKDTGTGTSTLSNDGHIEVVQEAGLPVEETGASRKSRKSGVMRYLEAARLQRSNENQQVGLGKNSSKFVQRKRNGADQWLTPLGFSFSGRKPE